jgi:chaperonin GroEL|uniref:60 kDa chaperonin (GroEL, HSPD1) n=1 Tax=uncultured marine group II/III euryarchaeote SAT1000_24_G08 TaxID=1456569 RepID=A0A075I614_9EURY|nr:60 kDa chaperonin (groEL, HSPD1) [uncultured marine group II/III euryarchaeote SAT1000_24_G08]
MAKQMIYGEEARKKLLDGITAATDAIKVTLGPKARTVVLDKSFGSPTIINDGVTIAKDIELPDPYENMGAQLVKEVAIKAQDNAGDGTSTAAILAQSLSYYGLRNVSAGMSPVNLKSGFDKAIETVVSELKSASTPVKESGEVIEQVASISANNDSEIGSLIASAVEKVGHDGIITVEEAKSMETSLKVVEGMEFDKGYVSPYMITDREKREAILENPKILLTDHTVSSAQDLIPALEVAVKQTKSPLLIISKDLEGEALATLVLNVASKVVKACAVKAPGFGDEQGEQLEDIAILTGGTVVVKDQGSELKDITEAHLGTAEKVIIGKNKTTLISGGGSKKAIDGRVSILKSQSNVATSKWDKEKLDKRIGRLSGGVAVLEIGAATETEMKEKKGRVDDALNATRAAMAEGVVAGGGVALLRASESLEKLAGKLSDEESVGVKIVRDALAIPSRQIADNAGEDGSVVVSKIREGKGNFGFNARTNTYEDLMKAGVVDPVKVTRNAIQAAGSIAGLVLTTETLVCDIPEENSGMPAMPDMGGMGGMGGMM